MDLLCDNLVGEILRHLPAKYLHRVRAVARRYNSIFLSPGFTARYWESHAPHLTGVFIQSDRPWRQRARFLDGSARTSATESMFAVDLASLPRPPPGPAARSREIFIVHATAGLLLCSRGEYNAVEYYVCNPVTWQWVALPKLPWPPAYLSGLLSVFSMEEGNNIKIFQVVLFNHPRFWDDFGDGCLELKVFSSATGLWKEESIQPPIPMDVEAYAPPFLSQSGTAYWMGYWPTTDVNGTVVAYSIEDGSVRYQCTHQYLHHDVFPYVHPAHPVEIPEITKAPIKLKDS